MADIIDLFEYRKAQETRHTLLAAFTKAAAPLYVVDVTRLVAGAREMGGWDLPDQPNIVTPTGRASFALAQAEYMAPTIVAAFPVLDEHEVVLKISGQLEKVAAHFHQYIENGVSWTDVRKAWPKAIDDMAGVLTEALLPRIHKITRNGAPNPRNG